MFVLYYTFHRHFHSFYTQTCFELGCFFQLRAVIKLCSGNSFPQHMQDTEYCCFLNIISIGCICNFGGLHMRQFMIIIVLHDSLLIIVIVIGCNCFAASYFHIHDWYSVFSK